MTKIRFKRKIGVPTTGNENGDKIVVQGQDGNIRNYEVLSDGQPHLVKGISEDEQARLNRLTDPNITKLEQDYSKSQLDTKFSEQDSRIQQTVAETIPVTGTVLPRGANIPSYITTVGKTELYGGTGGTTYTNTGRPAPNDKFIIDAGYVATGFYDKQSDTWSLGSSVALPIPTGVPVINPAGSGLPTEKATADYVKPLFNNALIELVTEDILPTLTISLNWLRANGTLGGTGNGYVTPLIPVKIGDIIVVKNKGNVITDNSNLYQYDSTGAPIKNYGTNFGKTPDSNGYYTNSYTITSDGFVRSGSRGDTLANSGFASIVITHNKISKIYAVPDDIDNITIGTSKINNGAVTPEKTDLFIHNLVGSEDFVDGKFVNDVYGTLQVNSSYSATEIFIPVKPGTDYIKSNTDRFALYSAANESSFTRGANGLNKFKTSSIEKFVRLTSTPAAKGSFMLVEGTMLPQTYLKKTDYRLKSELMGVVERYVPKLSLPSSLHILLGYENSLYKRAFIEKYMPYDFYVFSYGTNWKDRQRMIRLLPTENSAGNLTVELKDYVSTLVLERKQVTVITNTTSKNTPVKITVVGDSFIHNGMGYGHAATLLSGLTFVGTRTSYGVPYKAEGRGGWTLNDYFTRNKSTVEGYSPFLHPTQNYRFLGVTGFWAIVYTNPSVADSYQGSGFYDVLQRIGFNSNGFPSSPASNDLVYDSTASQFKYWNGSAWTVISESDLTFEFNYPKYLSVFGVDTPDIFSFNLGMNDFSGILITDANWDIWKTRLETVIASVKAANPNIIIAICTHTVQFGSDNSASNQDIIARTHNLFQARKRVIDYFDTAAFRTANVHLVDVGSAFDGDFGLSNSSIKPFSDYAGTLTEIIDANAPHPSSDGYKQLATRFAGFIQSVR